MYDARPYTDYVKIEIYEHEEKISKTAEIPIYISQIEIPVFVPEVRIRSDLSIIVPDPDDFEARTTMVIKVRFPDMFLDIF